LKDIWKKISNWEAWPFELIYAPLAPFWVWNMLKLRSVWFFTPSNPKLTFGGLEGEPKREMYDLLPLELYPTTINILPQTAFNEVLAAISKAQIVYPFIVKPEIGGQGILLRKIDDEAALQYYHTRNKFEYIVQQMVHYPIEVSVFHIRKPNEQKGIVTGFLHKIPMNVVGNGESTLQQLVEQHPKASKRAGELHSKHAANWEKVLAKGEKYPLSYAANHNRGAQFVDLKEHIDDNLVAVFDTLSLQINDFFYGRYDIMCNSIEDLKQGKNYSILEYNGCGAEPNHFYDTGYTLRQAHKEILKHWDLLYQISDYNAQQGIKPWPFLKGWRFLRQTKKLYKAMRQCDAAMG
jgi:hypothetical protein